MNWPGYYVSSYGCDQHGMWSFDDRYTVNIDDRCGHSRFDTGNYTTLNYTIMSSDGEIETEHSATEQPQSKEKESESN